MISETVKTQIKKHALESFPNECCGFTVFDKDKPRAVPCKNSANDPEKYFSISPQDYLKISNRFAISAVYHSHPAGKSKFSPYDIINSKGHMINYIMYNVEKDNFIFYDPSKDKTFIDYKEYRVGSADCYTFVQDYFKELNITLKDVEYIREEDWHERRPNLARDVMKVNPELKKQKDGCVMKKHDFLLLAMIKGKTINHAAVYIGDNKIIHRPRNKFVTIEKLTPQKRSKITEIYRHEQLN